MRILLSLVFVLLDATALGYKNDSKCYAEFSKYDANAFLASGKRSTPRQCCHELHCEKQKDNCYTEQYRAYIAKKFTCPAGTVVGVTDWCPGHYNYTCTDPCQALGRNRCKNAGTCVPAGASYTCVCRPGFEGVICQINIDDCKPDSCNMTTNTRCVDGVNDFSCTCKPGYAGELCDIDIDECNSSPCLNGATCVDHLNGYSCVCAPGYTGVRCEIDIDECASSPCQNGATCNDKINRFKCDCPSRKYGVLCDTDICHPTPADVVFVLDSSISMTEEQFNKQLEFVANFSSHVQIGPRDFQISVITFSSEAHIEFYLNEHQDNASLFDALNNITYKRGITRTDLGLHAVKKVFSPGHGIERMINNTRADSFVYVLTDGLSTYRQKTKTAASMLKSGTVDAIATIGIGPDVLHQELMDIATDATYVYSVENFNSLYTVLKQLVHITCDECENSAASDVAIFLDSSSRMTSKQYDASKDAIIHIIDVMKRLSVNETRVSMTSFTDTIQPVLSMGETFDKDVIKTKVNLIDKSRDTSHVSIPMETIYQYARLQLVNSTESRPDAKKFFVMFTNGYNTVIDEAKLQTEKSLLKADRIEIVAVGSGDDLLVSGLHKLVMDNFNFFITNDDIPMSNLDVLQSEFEYNKCDLKGE